MPSDMPLPHESLTHHRPSPTERAPLAPEQSFPALRPRDPRTRAALCYALPLLPSLYTLWRERRNRFVRLHAAQSLVFFCGIALAQGMLFAPLAPLGARLGAGWAVTLVGLAFWMAFIALGLGGFILWLRMLNECVHGRIRKRPVLAPLTARLEAATLRFVVAASAAFHARRNGAA